MFHLIRVRPVTNVLLAAALTAPCAAQLDNPVYVDDSPQAWMLFQQAEDQVEDNVGEAARLYQELLSDFGLKLIPLSPLDDSQFGSVRSRVLQALRGNADLLERYRLIQSPAAQRLVDEGLLATAAQTCSLTGPGLEAMLQLGQRQLESGAFRTALHWLDEAIEHPDLDEVRAAHAWHMIGVAAHYLGDAARFEEATARLATMAGADEQLDHLALIARDGAGPRVVAGITPLDTSPASDLSDLIPEDIWSIELERSLMNRRYPVNPDDVTQGRDVREQRRRRGTLNTAAPTVAGEVVYVNEGHTVHALDRFTGRPVWPKPFSDLAADEPDDTNNDQTMDMNVVSVEGDSLVTITGHLLTRSRSNNGQVVCLDATTGRPRWTRDISYIDEADEFEQLFPHGRPIIAEGAVYVMARKARKQQLTAAYVIALDLQTGALRWARHISTSGSIRGISRPYSSLTYDRGSLFVATPLGAVARIEAHDGEIRWLKRYPVPLTTVASAQHEPWEFDQPVTIDERVVALRPDRRRVVALDRKTGTELESHMCTTSEGWGAPTYLLANAHSIYAVGRDVVAFRAMDLTTPVWRLSQPPEQTLEGEPLFDRRPEIRGRVQLIENELVVPTLFGVLLVDDETGRVIDRLDISSPGNPVAYDSQLLVAGSDRLESFMSFGRAEAMLRERIASAPTDPDPALSLLKLGIRVRDFSLALEAAGRVTDAMERAPYGDQIAGAHDELFRRLLEIDERGIAESREQGEELFALLNSIADSPARRIEYLLAYGSWLAQHAPQQAIERGYQAILSDPKLASEWRRSDGIARPAAAWAAERQQRLIEEFGRDIYAAQDDFARLRFEQISAETEPEPGELMSLVDEFPFASVGVDAAIEAADMHARRGAYRAALEALAAAHRLNPRGAGLDRLLGRYVELCRIVDWTDEAARSLRQVVAERPRQSLPVDGSSRAAAEWLARLAPEAQRDRRPRVGEPLGEALFIDGSLVPYFTPDVGAGPERILVRRDDELMLFTPGALDPLWTTPFEDAPAHILHVDEERILLWYAQAAYDESPRAVMLDAATGEVRWISADPIQQLGEPADALRRVNAPRRRLAEEEQFDPLKTFPMYNGRVLVMVQATGGALALSPVDGRTVRWTLNRTLEQVHHAVLHDGALIVAGIMRRTDALGGTVARGPRIVGHDPETGERLWQLEPVGDTTADWLRLTPFGGLAYGTEGGVELLSVHTGRRLWSSVASGSRGSKSAWTLPDRLLIDDRDRRMRTLALADGRMSPPFDLSFTADMNPLDLREVIPERDGLIARFRNRIVRFGFDGALLGADAITGMPDYRWLLPARDTYLVINAQRRQVPVDGQRERRTEFVYELHVLSENGKALGPPFKLPPMQQRVEDARLVGPWLYVSTRSQTFAIPLTSDG